jgi:hypothetical protein
MLLQMVVGGAASLINIAVHSVWTVFLDLAVHRYWANRQRGHFLRDRVFLMTATVAILMAAHVIEVLIWALVYAAVHAVPAGASRGYFAFVNYTTLGYGDILPAPEWLLLGPLTAMNGILLFGWSTAVIFEVVRTSAREMKG